MLRVIIYRVITRYYVDRQWTVKLDAQSFWKIWTHFIIRIYEIHVYVFFFLVVLVVKTVFVYTHHTRYNTSTTNHPSLSARFGWRANVTYCVLKRVITINAKLQFSCDFVFFFSPYRHYFYIFPWPCAAVLDRLRCCARVWRTHRRRRRVVGSGPCNIILCVCSSSSHGAARRWTRGGFSPVATFLRSSRSLCGDETRMCRLMVLPHKIARFTVNYRFGAIKYLYRVRALWLLHVSAYM